MLNVSVPNAANNLGWCGVFAVGVDAYPDGRVIVGGTALEWGDFRFRTYASPNPVLEALDEVQAGIDALEGKSDTLLAGQGDISAAIGSAESSILAAIAGIEVGDDSAALAALETKADSLLGGQGDIAGAIASIQSSIDAIESSDDTAALAALEGKADSLLAGQGDISSAIDAIESSDDTAALAALETKADALAAEIADLETLANGHSADLGEVNAKIDALEAKLDTIIQMLEDLPFGNGNQGGGGRP